MDSHMPDNTPLEFEPLFERKLPPEHPDATQMAIYGIANRVTRGEKVPKIRVEISRTSYKLVPKTDL